MVFAAPSIRHISNTHPHTHTVWRCYWSELGVFVRDRPVEGSVGDRRLAGGFRAQCRFLLNSCWSSVWISSNTLWCITSVWQENNTQQTEIRWIKKSKSKGWKWDCVGKDGCFVEAGTLRGAFDSVCLEVEPREIKCRWMFDSKSWHGAKDPLWPWYLSSGPSVTWLRSRLEPPSTPTEGGVKTRSLQRNVDRQKCYVK